MRKNKSHFAINKIIFFMVFTSFFAIILVIRLFQLQVLAHDYYQEIATREQYGFIELPAQRGDIIIKDYHSDEEFPIATNTNFNLLYADPALIENPEYIAGKIGPLIFDLEEERAAENERLKELAKNIAPETLPEEMEKLLKPLSDEDLKIQYIENLAEMMGEKQRQKILIPTSAPEEKLKELQQINVEGIEVTDDLTVYAYPPKIINPEATAGLIAEFVEIPGKKLTTRLEGENRYTVLKRKLEPEISEQIQAIFDEDEEDRFKGLVMIEEYYRYYPEGTLGANIIGYVDRENFGQYGIESTFNTELKGVAGKFQTKKDSIGRQITVGESVLKPAIDGDDIVLTIDRSIQMQVEKILEQTVKKENADSGQVLIMNPKTGAIIAMAHYPSFDPNNYGDVFKKIEINFTPEEIENLYPTDMENVYYFYRNPVTLDKYLIFEEKDDDGRSRYFRYENFVGPEAYVNKAVSWPYEPGSVFKTIAMSIAIDDNDVTPNTTYNDDGPIGVDFNPYKDDYDYEIKNSAGYKGLVNMTTVLAESLNTGMTFIAKKMGPALFYSYLEKFGFLTRTDIEFDSEITGTIKYWEDWTESELATHAFGQGISVTMIQLANAYSTIANGGILMQPYIIDEIRHDDGSVTKTEPLEIRRVISEETSDKMIAMLTYSTEEGVAYPAQVESHFVAGKTGTSQTYKHGQALSGSGTTIASFAGFGPVDDPQFVVLIKLDHPRRSEWGSQTAAPAFSEIAAYLYNYYNIPPDK